MLKALVKKQLLEVFSSYWGKKSGDRKKKGGSAGYIILMAVVFLFLAACFFFLGMIMSGSLVPAGMGWLYYSLVGIIALALGIFGSVFNTYSSMYRAKDNEMLLAMPIPAGYILFARLISIFAMCFLFSAVVWIPGIIAYLMRAGVTAANLIFPIILLIFINLIATVFTCLLGWVVALFAGKSRNKTVVTVIISVVAFVLYMMICTRLSEFMQMFVANSEEIGLALSTWVYPAAQLGKGATGEIGGFLIFILIASILFALCYFILTKTFRFIVTRQTSDKKVEYVEKEAKQNSVKKALFRRELKHFTSSATYILNTGTGVIFMVIAAVMMIVERDTMHGIVALCNEEFPLFGNAMPVLVVGLTCFMISMCPVSAPSVSLEGRSLWIVRSLPVSSADVLKTKVNFHVLMMGIPSAVFAVVAGYIMENDIVMLVLILVNAVEYVYFTAYLGVIVNLKKPNLTWTSEAIPIKQSAAVAVVLFGGWLVSAGIIGLGLLIGDKLGETGGLIVLLVILTLLNQFMNKWLGTKGVKLFEEL